MIDFEFLEKVLDLLNRSDAHTIEIRKKPWSTSIRVSKGGFNSGSGPVTYQVAAPSATDPPPASGAPIAEVPVVAEEPVSDLTDIKSPMVGTFYAQPEPGAEPYVRVGGRITPGQTLCIIEAMKIMNPIDSEVAGVIRKRLVEDGQPVEFGQVLFRVDSNA
jgi:acetyl-CoA carboxylase biotin carboxyl carrier protein